MTPSTSQSSHFGVFLHYLTHHLVSSQLPVSCPPIWILCFPRTLEGLTHAFCPYSCKKQQDPTIVSLAASTLS